MQEFKQKINCTVCDCCYNEKGETCSKNCITVTCGNGNCTCCNSYCKDSSKCR